MQKGLDLSHWDTVTDWSAIKASGIEFVYLKASQGADRKDPKFAGFTRGAESVGIPWGVYHFWQLGVPAEPQIANFQSQLTNLNPPLQPMFDFEDTDENPFTVADFDEALKFVALMTLPIFYTNKWVFDGKKFPIPAGFDSYPLWVADYGDGKITDPTGLKPRLPSPWTTFKIWQWTETGRCAGVEGDCDLSVMP